MKRKQGWEPVGPRGQGPGVLSGGPGPEPPGRGSPRKTDREWVCWTLSQKGIDAVAWRMGVDPDSFSDRDYEEVVRLFRDSLGAALDDWQEVLAEAIKQARGDEHGLA